jgi:DNA repair exonuclease SbcCD ATPase subunit
MKFKILRINNFMSYKTAEISLENRGLTLIEGQKNGITSFSNGSGKTNLLEAIIWCLWGSLYSKKIPANDVVFDGKADCSVSLEVDNFVVTRYRKHRKFKNELHLIIDGKDARGAKDEDTQEKINKLLGSTFESFSQSVFLGQGVLKSFASATETERKVILEKLLGNERYQEVLKSIISPNLKEIKEKLEDLNDDFELLTEEKTKSLGRVDFLKDKHRLFEKEKNIKVEGLRAKLNITTSASPDTRSAKEVENEIANAESYILTSEKALGSFSTLDAEILQIVQALTKLEIEQERNNTEIEKLERQLRAPITSLVNKNCPTCGKKVEESDVALYKKKIDDQLTLLKKATVVGVKPLRAELTKKKAEKETLLELERKIHHKRKSISDLRHELSDISKQEEKERLEKEKIKITLKEAIEQKSPYPELIAKEEQELKEIIKKDSNLLEQISKVKEEIPYWETYENIFSRTGRQELPSVPSLRLDNILPQLTDGTNRRLRELSDDLTAEFDTTSVTQRGKATDKFSIVIKNANGADVYGGNSGGERKLVDIAIMLALGEIVGGRSRQKIPILLLDELFSYLDTTNAEAVMDLLRNEAKIKDSVFVTTIDPHFSSMFDRKILVNKVGKESQIVSSDT